MNVIVTGPLEDNTVQLIQSLKDLHGRCHVQHALTLFDVKNQPAEKLAQLDAVFIDIQNSLDTLDSVFHILADYQLYQVAVGPASAEREALAAGASAFLATPVQPIPIECCVNKIKNRTSFMIAQDPVMQDLLEKAQRVAQSHVSLMLTGESGTGKEVFSRWIHEHSPRVGRPFVAINCAAIPEHLLESELFGYEKGSFTGATTQHKGKFEEAQGGTLLLDEITEMPLHLQAKLLRALQEKEIDRIGGKRPISVNIRVIATSNRDIQQAVNEGVLREDLYFRLSMLRLHLPPLRERLTDIVPLAEKLLKKYALAHNIPVKKLSAEARKSLKTYHWPGNVRELESMMCRVLLLSPHSTIQPEDLEPEFLKPRPLSTVKSVHG